MGRPNSEGKTFRYARNRVGWQYIGEGGDLSMIPDNKYDFLLSSHSLEHSANPLKCVAEWIRVVKPEGTILVVLPDSRRTFDHRRPITLFQHLVDDYRRGVGEDDLNHLEEILALHDLAMDPAAGNAEAFRARSLRNHENRALHHHVFDQALMREVLSFFRIETCYADAAPPFHLIALGTTSAKADSPVAVCRCIVAYIHGLAPAHCGFGPSTRKRRASPDFRCALHLSRRVIPRCPARKFAGADGPADGGGRL